MSPGKMTSIIDAMHRHAAQREHDVFCHFLSAGETISIHFGSLLRDSTRFACAFQQSGVQPGEVVIIVLNHTPDLLYSFLGAMLCGAVPTFMPYPTSKQQPGLYWRAHRTLFERIGAGALMTYCENIPLIREHLGHLPLRLLQPSDASYCPTHYGTRVQSADAIALLQHSSGTTGLKKGVALSHAAVIRQIESYSAVLGLSPMDLIVSWLPLYHDMGLIACFMLPLVTGVPVVQLDPFEWVAQPLLLFSAINRFRGTLSWLPNFGFQHLCRAVRKQDVPDLSSMRAWINCSEPCRLETFDEFLRCFAFAGVAPDRLQVCYAMAETVFAVTQTALGQSPSRYCGDATGGAFPSSLHDSSNETSSPALLRSLLSAGAPIPGLSVRIVDGERNEVPDRCVGEISISGDCLFSGYFRQPEETATKLRDEWYYSGDLGFMHEGELYITGRNEDVIIVHGRNYYAHELEYLVNQVAGVHPGRCVAVGWFRAEVGSEGVLVLAETDVTSGAELVVLADAIKNILQNEAGLVPFDVRLVGPGWLVKTTSGKLARKTNLAKYFASYSGEPDAPST